MRLCSTNSAARRSISAERRLRQQRDGVLIELAPANRVQIAKEAGGVVIPTPPQVAGQRPQPLLCRSNEAVERTRLGDHRRYLRRGLRQHPNLVFAIQPLLDGLHHQHSLQHTAVQQRHSKKGLEVILIGFAKILESRMRLHLLHRHRAHLFRYQARQPFMQRQPQRADAMRAQSEGRRQHQVRSIRLQEISGTDVHLKTLGDQRDHVHQSLCGLAAYLRERTDFIQCQHITLIQCLAHLRFLPHHRFRHTCSHMQREYTGSTLILMLFE